MVVLRFATGSVYVSTLKWRDIQNCGIRSLDPTRILNIIWLKSTQGTFIYWSGKTKLYATLCVCGSIEMRVKIRPQMNTNLIMRYTQQMLHSGSLACVTFAVFPKQRFFLLLYCFHSFSLQLLLLMSPLFWVAGSTSMAWLRTCEVANVYPSRWALTYTTHSCSFLN